jgi:hypothetical protein
VFIAQREDVMRKSDLYVGAATFVAIALAMPLAALEPIAAPAAKAQSLKVVAGACGSKLATVCDRAA